MPNVLITPEKMRVTDAPYVQHLQNAGLTVCFPKNPHFARGLGGEDEVIRELANIHAVIASAEFFGASSIPALPQLRVIARAGVGYDRVNVPIATQHNIPVTITPGANHEAVAELTLALLFGLTKQLVNNDQDIRAGNWSREPLMSIRGRTFGVYGLGRIGRSTAIRAKALGCRVIAVETNPDESFIREYGIEVVDQATILAESDFLTIHCPLNDDTHHMFNASLFAKMKRGAILLNTARGPLINEADLVSALESGQLGGAGLDVFEQEPPDADNPLLKMKNVIVAPHIAGADDVSLVAMGMEAAECIVDLYQGHWPEGRVVNEEIRDGWTW